MLTRIFKTTIIVMILLPGLVACTYDQISPEAVAVPDEVFFTTDIQPIFDASCNTAGCHDGTVSPDLRPSDNLVTILLLTQVVDTTDTENSLLWKKINDGGSMEGYASDKDRALIHQWIELDAPDN